MAAFDEKILLVEGPGDRHVMCQLFEAYGTWGNKKSEWPFNILPCKSNTDLLGAVLPFHLNARAARVIGVVLDADFDPTTCWQTFRTIGLQSFPNIPEAFPSTGLIHDDPRANRRLGFWMMPDNSQRGMLETFLQYLIPPDIDSQTTWEFAKSSAQEALANQKAPYREVHVDKACIHTWLAWQDPPGQNFGDAISDRCLRPEVPLARQFIEWLWTLFEIPGQPQLKSK